MDLPFSIVITSFYWLLWSYYGEHTRPTHHQPAYSFSPWPWSIDRDQSPCHPPANNVSSTLPGSALPVTDTYFQSTDICPSWQTSNHRKCGRYCVSCGFFTILPAPASRRPNLGPPHVAMPTPSIPRTRNHLFSTAVNSTFYEQTSVGRAVTADGLSQLRWQCWQRPEANLTTSPILSHSYPNSNILPNPRCRSSCRSDWPDDHLGFGYGLGKFSLLSYPRIGRTDQPK